MNSNLNNGILTVYLSGHIDSANAPEIEKQIMKIADAGGYSSIVLDMKDLDYISSAGLRIVLKLKKKCGDLSAVNASSEVYEIFDVTGFTQLIPIAKSMREISVEDCEVVGEGANGIVYRIGRDTIVKVDKNGGSLEEIQHERELSRTAFLLGIPTAISYDVVKVGDRYGAVFELLNAKSFDELMRESAEYLEFVASGTVGVAKIIHSTIAPANLPDSFEMINGWLKMIEAYLTPDENRRFASLVAALPHNGTMIHGDLHIKNLMLQGDETLLIDMDTLSVGHPIFELAYMYNAYKGFGLIDPTVVEKFMGFSADLAYRLWRRILALYLCCDDTEALNRAEDQAALIGLLRLMRRRIERSAVIKEDDDETFIEACRTRIKELLTKVDTLELAIHE